MLQIDLGGFEARSHYRALILISILLVREMLPSSVSESQHMHCSCPAECPPGAHHSGGHGLVSSSLCGEELICLEMGEGLLWGRGEKECTIG